jgi:hypothetical protein
MQMVCKTYEEMKQIKTGKKQLTEHIGNMQRNLIRIPTEHVIFGFSITFCVLMLTNSTNLVEQ